MTSFEPIQQHNVRLAATVVLVRPAEAGFQVYMVQRPGRGAFPDLHVFPGGKLDTADWLPEQLQHVTPDIAEASLGVRGALRYWVAAIRECFEESGVLLARRQGVLLTREQTHVEPFVTLRQKLVDGEVALSDVCAEHGLQLAGDLVHYFSHWLTPESAPHRFDTRFFLAVMPPGQATEAHASEVRGGHWIEPAAALDAHRQGRWQMISPTLITLDSLAACQTVEDLIAAVRAERHLPPLTDTLRAEGMCPLR